MKLVCPWAKLIVMLRNPTDRAYSHYEMQRDLSVFPPHLRKSKESIYNHLTFMEAIRQEIDFLHTHGLSPTVNSSVFEKEVLARLPTEHGKHSIVARGLYAMQLEQWFKVWPKEQLSIYSIKEVIGSKEDVQHTLNRVFEYLGLPHYDIQNIEPKNSRKYKPMPEDCRALLDEFYAPYNARLFELLGRELVW